MIFFVCASALLIASTSALTAVSSSCKVRNGFEPVDGVCDAYIECQDFHGYEKLCPDGLYFDANVLWPSDPCGYPSDVPCDGRTQPADPTAECPHQYGFFPTRGANINDCGQYRMCVEGRAVDMYCPTGLAFNPDTNRCDWPEEVPSCNLKNFLGFTCPPGNRVTNHKNFGISPLHQLLLTLRFYALGTMLVAVGDYIGVSKSAASRIVKNVSEAIARLYPQYIYIHNNTQADFYRIARFPRVLGAIDGTHILMQSPTECESGIYGNRWLLGDSAYPCTSYLLTPLLNTESVNELNYNQAHIKTRNTIERYEENCYEFYSCINGNPRLLSCDPGYAFDERKARCVEAHLVNCDHQ